MEPPLGARPGVQPTRLPAAGESPRSAMAALGWIWLVYVAVLLSLSVSRSLVSQVEVVGLEVRRPVPVAVSHRPGLIPED